MFAKNNVLFIKLFIANSIATGKVIDFFSGVEKAGLTKHLTSHHSTLLDEEKQQLLLALAAISGKEILVFDKPTSGLDGANVVYHRNIIRT